MWSAALFYGALWGVVEATAGHGLHLARVPGLAGFIMFPLGFLLMSRAFRDSENIIAVFMTSWVAAGIKLADLLLPGADFLAVWNPAQAILLEGLAAAGLLVVLKTTQATVAWTSLASFSWRLIHIALSLWWAGLLGAKNLIQTQPAFLFRFLLLDSLMNGFIIYLLAKTGQIGWPLLASKRNGSTISFRTNKTNVAALGRPALAAALLVAAFSLELVL